ncbi:transposase [Brevibacillus reuszeri]|uniref:transposase n=1 Tax=Brevibacillus reuszeri TaxID=54915 RepID=UPI003D1ECCC8
MDQIKKSYSLEFKHHVVEKFEQGATYNEIKETYGIDLRMFRRWVRKYRDNGLKGLEDRRGRPRKTDDTFEKLLPPGEKIQRREAEVEFLKKLFEARKGERRQGRKR